VEIQKQILFSIPKANKGAIESTIKIIASRKGDIEKLRQQINDQIAEEFAGIVAIEEVKK